MDEDDSFYSSLGCKLVDILEACDMLNRVSIRSSTTKQYIELKISDRNLLSKLQNRQIYTIPTKLPIIVKPKPFDSESLGGFLLNDVDYQENMIIEKKGYKIAFQVSNINIYYMVNNISATGFKINTTLLDFITNNDDYGLLIDPSVPHEYEALKKRTKYQ